MSTVTEVISGVLHPEALLHLERDVSLLIKSFDSGYKPKSRQGSLSHGKRSAVI